MTTPSLPIFTSPSASGQLSNTRGANTGGDALQFILKYQNPKGAADPPGCMRIIATKTLPTLQQPPITQPSAALQTVTDTLMDTWWLGAGTQSSLPPLTTFNLQPDLFVDQSSSAGTLFNANNGTAAQCPTGCIASFKPASVGTAIAKVGNFGAFLRAAAASVSPLFGQATVATHLLVAVVTANGTADITTAAGGWVKAKSSFSLGGLTVAIWYKVNCGTAETAPTFTATGATTMCAQLSEWSGVDTATGLDQAGVGTPLSLNPSYTSPTASCLTTDSQAGNLVIGGVRYLFSGATTITIASPNASVFNNWTSSQNTIMGNDAASSQADHSSFFWNIIPNSTGVINPNPNMTAVWNNRIYIASSYPQQASSFGTLAPSRARIFSAPINGPSLGTWREEVVTGLITRIGWSAMCILNGYMYMTINSGGIPDGNPFMAPINADGTLGTFSLLTGTNAGTLISPMDCLLGYDPGTGDHYLVHIPLDGSNVTRIARQNADGTVTSWFAGTALPANRQGGMCVIRAETGAGFSIVVIGGGSPSVATMAVSTISYVPGGNAVGATAFSVGAGQQNLPAARANALLVQANGYVYIIGGTNGNGGMAGGISTSPAAGQTTIYYNSLQNIFGTPWLTATAVMPYASEGACGVGSSVFPTSGLGGAGTGRPVLFILGGTDTTGAMRSDINVVQCDPVTGNGLSIAAASVGAELTNAQLGTGGVVTNNIDGSVTVTFLWQPSVIGGFGLSDGDVVTISVQFTDQLNGDPSPIALTSVKIGQPPTISAVSPSGATTDCQPTITFQYNPGAGGAKEFKYQVQLKNNAGVIVADTGLLIGNANSFSPKLYPMLASALLASTVITVYSADSPMLGSTNSAQATTTFTPTQTAPSNPGTTSLSADNVGGALIPSWKDPAGGVTPAFNRLYWRLSGSSIWLIAKDNIVATQNVQQNFTLMDTIPMGVAVEIGVSSYVTATGDSESAIVSCGTATISPDYHQDLGGFTAMLHILGNGPNQRVPIPNIPPIKFDRHIDAEGTVMFGNTAISTRYGVYNYREITISVIPLDSQIATLDSVLAAAQLGSILVYRDTVGNVIYCSLPTDRSRQKDLYYADELKLVEAQFTFTP